MGYLDNSSVTVDAILTKKGRELLAKGAGSFRITQFALGDDEVDYSLWNTDHPLGTDYYGIIIENMPILEAIPDETQGLRSKLITLPKTTQRIPIIKVTPTSISVNAGQRTVIKPDTINGTNANSTNGYTCILSDSTIGTLTVSVNVANPSVTVTTATYIGDNKQSVTVSGLEFTFTAAQLNATTSATITIIANETGGSVTIPVTVQKFTI